MMTRSATIKLLKPFAGQRDILRDDTRFKVVAIGRQWGKTELAIIDAVHRLLRGQNIWFCSPTNQNNKRVYPKLKAVLIRIPGIYTHDTDMIIRMPTGNSIKFVSLEKPDNLRGEGLDHIIIDEAGFIRHGVWDKVLRPMLLARQGSALFLSSPNGRNEFWQWYRRGLDANEPQWKSFHAPSSSSPVLSESEITDIRRNAPERVFRQEYLAEFLDDGGAVFRNLDACIIHGTPQHQGQIVFGVDWGKMDDYTVITALDVTTHHVVEIQRFNQIDWQLQRGRLQAMAQRWNPLAILAERNSIGDPNIEELQRAGLNVQGFNTTSASKQQIINALSLAFEQQDIFIPNDDTLLFELQSFTVERLPSGNFRYSAPAGLHDDTVISLALAWRAMTQGITTRITIPDIYGAF